MLKKIIAVPSTNLNKSEESNPNPLQKGEPVKITRKKLASRLRAGIRKRRNYPEEGNEIIKTVLAQLDESPFGLGDIVDKPGKRNKKHTVRYLADKIDQKMKKASNKGIAKEDAMTKLIDRIGKDTSGDRGVGDTEYSTSDLLRMYNNSKIINPPKDLPCIYYDKKQTPETINNLEISYEYFKDTKKSSYFSDGTQLFSIPGTNHNCAEYCLDGYSELKNNYSSFSHLGIDEKENGWIKLEDKKDFSCRENFEKVFAYFRDSGCFKNAEFHWARQWGDGTILSKEGMTWNGATPVWRTISPEDPAFKGRHGEVNEVWVRYYGDRVPDPYLRSQSVHIFCRVPGSKDWMEIQDGKLE